MEFDQATLLAKIMRQTQMSIFNYSTVLSCQKDLKSKTDVQGYAKEKSFYGDVFLLERFRFKTVVAPLMLGSS